MAEVVGTGRFSMEKARKMASWQRDVADIAAGVAPVPETEEYGVGSFVFEARRPFHPGRLHDFVLAHFFLSIEASTDGGEGEGGEAGEAGAGGEGGDGLQPDVLEFVQLLGSLRRPGAALEAFLRPGAARGTFLRQGGPALT